MKHKILFVIIIILALSCKKEVSKTLKIQKDKKVNPTDSSFVEEDEIFDSGALAVFPKTGNKPEDFELEPYKIQYQTEGFLNDDQLKDIVIVLQNKNDNKDIRPTLVLIKQKSSGYNLQETSWNALTAEYSYEGYKIYEDESINIDKDKMLNVALHGLGPVGTRVTSYKYLNNQLVIAKIHVFNMGAGSQISIDYDLISGVADMELINTMVDSMPSTTDKKKFKLDRQQLFVDDDPDRVLNKLPKTDW